MQKLTTTEHKLIWVEGLLIDCPFGNPLSDCPASELRKLPIPERISMAENFSENELDGIINHHVNCLNRREHPVSP